MEAIDLLLSRRSVPGMYLADPAPSDEDLQKIMQAAIRVPDHGKLGPWRLQVIRKDGQKMLGEFYADLFKKNNPDAEERLIEIERNRPQLAPILICATAKLDPAHKIPVVEQQLSGGALCGNLLNAAHALGYAANWVTGWAAYDADVKKALGHSADTNIIGFIYLGTPSSPPQERPRPTVEDVVSEWTGPSA